jgi:hypothetical protein
MGSYRGSIGVQPPDNALPDDKPEQCSLCGSTGSLVWYVVEGRTDHRGRQLQAKVLARWWAVYDDCDQLVARQAVQALIARTATAPQPVPSDVIREFTARARPFQF